MQDRSTGDKNLQLVQDWKHGRVKELAGPVLMLYTGIELRETGQTKAPLGLNFLAELPSDKYRKKLQKVWNWCKSIAAELSVSSHPARQPSMPPPAKPDQKQMRKPEGLCTNWDLQNQQK
jgi:hypothetical protein